MQTVAWEACARAALWEILREYRRLRDEVDDIFGTAL